MTPYWNKNLGVESPPQRKSCYIDLGTKFGKVFCIHKTIKQQVQNSNFGKKQKHHKTSHHIHPTPRNLQQTRISCRGARRPKGRAMLPNTMRNSCRTSDRSSRFMFAIFAVFTMLYVACSGWPCFFWCQTWAEALQVDHQNGSK